MLLLGFHKELDEFKYVEFRNVRLSAIVTDLRIGEVKKANSRPVFRSAFSNQPDDVPVVMLRMSHFKEDNERIDWELVREDLIRQEQKEETEVIDRAVMLDLDDLLINFRGQTRVLRVTQRMIEEMPADLLQRGLRLAATNNFVLMRPNSQLVDAAFLQMIMDILLEDVSNQWNNYQQEESTDFLLHRYFSMKYMERGSLSKQPVLPIGVRELKELSIDIPALPEIQRAITEKYMILLEKEREARNARMSYRMNMRHYINPNILP